MKNLLTRRKFLQYGFLSSTVFVMHGCSLFSIVTPSKTLALMQEDIFPKAKELGINTQKYMHLILRHTRVSKSDKEFIKNGVKWLNEEAVSLYGRIYINLPKNEREDVIRSIVLQSWGESFVYDVLRYTFEATFADPVYGVNTNEAGWKWLSFEAGMPRPKKAYL
ncbi:gluconate 2-dehydrogenase subunit 3 family protein [Sulfurimonas sp.]